MNEIPKNSQGQSIPPQTQSQAQKVEQVKTEAVQDLKPAASSEMQTKEIKEIPENPADRSAVKVDNLENDIKVFAANPEIPDIFKCAPSGPIKK